MNRRRKRRADDGVYLPKDTQSWRTLVRRARQAADDPERYGHDLWRAAQRAMRAVAPAGQRHRESPFVRLALKGRLPTPAVTEPEARAALASDLRDLAGQVAAVLDILAQTPEPRRRADLE